MALFVFLSLVMFTLVIQLSDTQTLTVSIDTERRLGWHRLGSPAGRSLGWGTSFHHTHPPRHPAHLVEKHKNNKKVRRINNPTHLCFYFLRLTLNIEGDAVGEDFVIVAGDTCERLLVRLSAGHQNVVALNGERPVGVSVLSCGRFSRHPRLPPANRK